MYTSYIISTFGKQVFHEVSKSSNISECIFLRSKINPISTDWMSEVSHKYFLLFGKKRNGSFFPQLPNTIAICICIGVRERRPLENRPYQDEIKRKRKREKNIVMIYGISIKILPLKFITLSMLSDISSQIECGCGYYYIEWVMLLSVCGARAQTPTDTQKYSQKMYFWTIPMNVYSQIASLSWFGLSLNRIGCYRNATQLLRK